MHKNIFILSISLLLVYLIGFGIDVMDIDASQYASMSSEMLRTGNYLQVYDLGQEYLDKPPFLFWISSFSMKFFGVNNFSYRLPSFLFACLAILSTYRFSRLFYNHHIAMLAALILASCQGFFLMLHDVRTDTILMGWTMFSIWQLAEWYQQDRWSNFVLACAAIAGGMMTKGPVALMVPVFAFGTHFLLQRKIKPFFKWQYLPGILIIGILLLPMCMGLYKQFDLHPEKIVNGKNNVSGLRFFFWTQSFGRITGESSWNNNAGIFFLLQNMLWSFLPWIIFFLIGLFVQIKNIIGNRFTLSNNEEAITTGGFLITYLSLGMSRYQLPHYIFVAFPLAAIITARLIYSMIEEKKFPSLLKNLTRFHLVVFSLLWIAMILLVGCFKTIPFYATLFAVLALAGFWAIYFKQRKQSSTILTISLYSIIGLNLFMNSFVYPALLSYQAGGNAGRWIKANRIPPQQTFFYQYDIWRSVNFYSGCVIGHKDSADQINAGDYIITEASQLKSLDAQKRFYEIVHSGPDFPVSKLSINFIRPDMRERQVRHFVIIKIKS